MLDEAFPFWAERARARNGGFFERLDLAGRGIADEDSRVRLQARMAFTFALAADLGWDRSRSLELTERGLRVLVVDCRREDGLYGRTVRPGSGLVDASAETYDTAFALLAFATAYRVFGLDSALEAGTELSHAIDALLARDRHEGGYRERLPAPEIRDQNPHMHLTEASLAWYEATADEAALKRARAIIAFVEERFFDRDSGLLLEFSGVDIAHNRCEAGHMFEWVWILGRLRELTGQTRQDFIDRLYAGGMRLLHGLDYFPLSQHPGWGLGPRSETADLGADREAQGPYYAMAVGTEQQTRRIDRKYRRRPLPRSRRRGFARRVDGRDRSVGQTARMRYYACYGLSHLPRLPGTYRLCGRIRGAIGQAGLLS